MATLSRIERDKQGLDLGLFLVLCRILKTAAHEVLGSEDSENLDPLARQIGRLNHDQRMQLWQELTDERRERRRAVRTNVRRLSEEIEELLAQLAYVQSEVESFRGRVRNR